MRVERSQATAVIDDDEEAPAPGSPTSPGDAAGRGGDDGSAGLCRVVDNPCGSGRPVARTDPSAQRSSGFEAESRSSAAPQPGPRSWRRFRARSRRGRPSVGSAGLRRTTADRSDRRTCPRESVLGEQELELCDVPAHVAASEDATAERRAPERSERSPRPRSGDPVNVQPSLSLECTNRRRRRRPERPVDGSSVRAVDAKTDLERGDRRAPGTGGGRSQREQQAAADECSSDHRASLWVRRGVPNSSDKIAEIDSRLYVDGSPHRHPLPRCRGARSARRGAGCPVSSLSRSISSDAAARVSGNGSSARSHNTAASATNCLTVGRRSCGFRSFVVHSSRSMPTLNRSTRNECATPSFQMCGDYSPASSTKRQSAFASRICGIERAFTSSSRGEQTRYARQRAREIATFSRLRESRNSSPRGTSSPLELASE